MPTTDPTQTESAVQSDWFATAFDELYPVVYAHRTVEAATVESAFAIDQLRLCTTCTALDLCCGNGRHIVHLLKHTPHVIGLDYSPALLSEAKRLLAGQGHLLRGDMRDIPFDGVFDAVANFFTSFGYFQTDKENCRVARGIARALRPHGRFFMDYLNPVHVRAHLDPESRREAGPFEIVERRWIDDALRRVNKTTTIFRDGQVVNQTAESVRLYENAELISLLSGAGLAIEAVYGDYDASPVAPTKPRQIVVGTRA